MNKKQLFVLASTEDAMCTVALPFLIWMALAILSGIVYGCWDLPNIFDLL